MRIMAIDPGEKRIGVAISDPSETIASPLGVIQHSSRPIDAANLAELARQNNAGLIVLGYSEDEDDIVNPSRRRAQRLAQAIQLQCDIPIIFWDESFSTQVARTARIEMDVPRKKRSGHMDEVAAVVILQTYLDRETIP